MKRSFLAVVAGFVVFMLFGLLTRASWGEGSNSTLSLFGGLVGMLAAGYTTAFISRRAYVTHAFAVVLLCAAVPAIVGHFTGVHRDWPQWFVGLFSSAITTTWSGFFRGWQVSHKLPPPMRVEESSAKF